MWFINSCAVDAVLPIMARQRYLQVRSIGHIGISPLALKKTKNSKDGLIRHHLLQCDNSSSSDEFNILAQDNKNCLREIKKSILINAID